MNTTDQSPCETARIKSGYAMTEREENIWNQAWRDVLATASHPTPKAVFDLLKKHGFVFPETDFEMYKSEATDLCNDLSTVQTEPKPDPCGSRVVHFTGQFLRHIMADAAKSEDRRFFDLSAEQQQVYNDAAQVIRQHFEFRTITPQPAPERLTEEEINDCLGGWIKQEPFSLRSLAINEITLLVNERLRCHTKAQPAGAKRLFSSAKEMGPQPDGPVIVMLPNGAVILNPTEIEMAIRNLYVEELNRRCPIPEHLLAVTTAQPAAPVEVETGWEELSGDEALEAGWDRTQCEQRLHGSGESWRVIKVGGSRDFWPTFEYRRPRTTPAKVEGGTPEVDVHWNELTPHAQDEIRGFYEFTCTLARRLYAAQADVERHFAECKETIRQRDAAQATLAAERKEHEETMEKLEHETLMADTFEMAERGQKSVCAAMQKELSTARAEIKQARKANAQTIEELGETTRMLDDSSKEITSLKSQLARRGGGRLTVEEVDDWMKEKWPQSQANQGVRQCVEKAGELRDFINSRLFPDPPAVVDDGFEKWWTQNEDTIRMLGADTDKGKAKQRWNARAQEGKKP